MTLNGDAFIFWLAGPLIILFGLVGLFTAQRRSRQSEGDNSASMFIVPSLIQITIGAFCIYQAVSHP